MASYAQPHGPANEFKIVKELVTRWNDGDLDITNNQAEKLAFLAAQHGLDFDSESNPIGKFAFDLANTATFGLVPNTWRPVTVGEKWHGESKAEQFAGGLGTIGGLGTGVGAAGKLLGWGARSAGKGIAGLFGRGGSAVSPVSPLGGAVSQLPGQAQNTQALLGVGRNAMHSGQSLQQMGMSTNRLKIAVESQKALNARRRAYEIASGTLNQGRNYTNQMVNWAPAATRTSFQPGWGSVALGTGMGIGMGNYLGGPSDEQIQAEQMMNQYNTLGMY